MKNDRSDSVLTFSGAIGSKKLGHPVPDSNLVSELNSALPQQMHRYMPLSGFSAYRFENGRSVPFLRATLYCSGVSCLRHSSSVLTTLSSITSPFLCPESVNSTIDTLTIPDPC